MNKETSFDQIFSITIDVDWAAPEVLADLLQLLDERDLKATLFCTHPGIQAGRHERAIHPNFRRSGDSFRKVQKEFGEKFESLSEVFVYQHIVQQTLAFCSEAIGVRAHSLIYDSQLLHIYQEAGLQYESNYLMPLVQNLKPFWKEYDILEIPIFFNDHFELKSNATKFQIENLKLTQPGLKVIQFHPNMVFLNAKTNQDYLDSKPFYHDVEKLKAHRAKGLGTRTFFLELIDFLAKQKEKVCTLFEINEFYRAVMPNPWLNKQSVEA